MGLLANASTVVNGVDGRRLRGRRSAVLESSADVSLAASAFLSLARAGAGDCAATELLREAGLASIAPLSFTESMLESLFCATAAVLLGDVIVAKTNDSASIEHNDLDFFADTVFAP